MAGSCCTGVSEPTNKGLPLVLGILALLGNDYQKVKQNFDFQAYNKLQLNESQSTCIA